MHTKSQKSVMALLAAIFASVFIVFDLVLLSKLLLIVSKKLLGGLLLFDIVSISSYALVPHFIMFALACIFNWVGYGTNIRGFTLTAGILYCVAIVMCPVSLLFLLVPLVLAFIGFSHQGVAVSTDETQCASEPGATSVTFTAAMIAVIILAVLIPALLLVSTL